MAYEAIHDTKVIRHTTSVHDGMCAAYDSVKHYLTTSYPKLTGNGDSSISLFRALRCCIKYGDNLTMNKLLQKAMHERWSEKELNRMTENIRKNYIES